MTSKRKLRRRIAELELNLAARETFVPPLPMDGGPFVFQPNALTSSVPPWCGRCGGFHIPGQGRCTATYTRWLP